MNSFENILARLKEAVPSDISVIEGSFAGDVLHAVANELARIYSQEIDTLYQKAFVSTAEGQWLDAACADYGIDRKEDESDESLRKRTLAKIRQQASSGNEAHYESWAMEVEGVEAAKAVGLARGAGTVDVYILPGEQELINSVADHIEQLRPVCVDVAVSAATQKEIAVSASVVLIDGVALEGVIAEFKEKCSQWLEEIKLTRYGSVISLIKVAGILMECSGVLDVRDVSLDEGSESLVLSSGEYGLLGQVNIIKEVLS